MGGTLQPVLPTSMALGEAQPEGDHGPYREPRKVRGAYGGHAPEACHADEEEGVTWELDLIRHWSPEIIVGTVIVYLLAFLIYGK